MIPKKIHYCWFGHREMPQVAKECIASWHRYMPDWEYHLWNEDNFDVNSTPYTKEAYEAGKYAFVSDVARLVALEKEGGIYLDVRFEVYKSFEPLLSNKAFAGFEGCKRKLLMMGVLGSEAHGEWINEVLRMYDGRHFRMDDGTLNLTTNVLFTTMNMEKNGFVRNWKEQYYKDLHVYPTDYFSPRHTTGEYFRTENTYCEHRGVSSWANQKGGMKTIAKIIGNRNMTRLIKLKRRLLG